VIEINDEFTVAAPPAQTYAVLADPHAVVECVNGAGLGAQHEDGSYDGTMTVKFSALRVQFKGKVALELDPENLSGTVIASGRDGQGGTKFKATAGFTVTPVDGGAASHVTTTGEVNLSGKLASVIDNAAAAVVRRMTAEFVEALSLRCASESAHLGPDVAAEAAQALPAPAVLLLHGFGGGPADLRGWGEALAAEGIAVSIPRLPGHGSQWRDLDERAVAAAPAAAAESLAALRADHDVVVVMGISAGATFALRLAETRPDDVAGVVAVNPAVTGLRVPSPLRRRLAFLLPAVRVRATGVRRPGVRAAGYDRLAIRALIALQALGGQTVRDLGSVSAPVLLGASGQDSIVRTTDADLVASGLTAAKLERVRFARSDHHVPLDEDAAELFRRSAGFVADVAERDVATG
jgi:carboxylesterase